MNHLDHIMEPYWTTLVVFLMGLNIVLLMGQHWVSHLDIQIELCLTLMKVSKLALLMVSCLVLHFDLIMDTYLGLMKELCWFHMMDDFMVIMK